MGKVSQDTVDRVHAWRRENPNGKQAECVRALGIGATAVSNAWPMTDAEREERELRGRNRKRDTTKSKKEDIGTNTANSSLKVGEHSPRTERITLMLSPTTKQQAALLATLDGVSMAEAIAKAIGEACMARRKSLMTLVEDIVPSEQPTGKATD